jgi:hypothetical protein
VTATLLRISGTLLRICATLSRSGCVRVPRGRNAATRAGVHVRTGVD